MKQWTDSGARTSSHFARARANEAQPPKGGHRTTHGGAEACHDGSVWGMEPVSEPVAQICVLQGRWRSKLTSEAARCGGLGKGSIGAIWGGRKVLLGKLPFFDPTLPTHREFDKLFRMIANSTHKRYSRIVCLSGLSPLSCHSFRNHRLLPSHRPPPPP